jgi:hypothetical protein
MPAIPKCQFVHSPTNVKSPREADSSRNTSKGGYLDVHVLNTLDHDSATENNDSRVSMKYSFKE